MQLIDQHAKKIMEGCKERALEAGLRFHRESLEYIVTNRDLLELSPKMMIPTLYDYWVQDVEVIREKGIYELYPHNPYETVINTRPPISFYNDNNPDWLNVMIFYHVLAHIDFFHNNLYFRHTWDYDFNGRALSDKRLIAMLRSEKGRWVDYIIEFARGIDNLTAYHKELSLLHQPPVDGLSARLNYYFDVFLQSHHQSRINKYVEEVERYNECVRQSGELGEDAFFPEVLRSHPEFESSFKKYCEEKSTVPTDLMEYLLQHSDFLKKDVNNWMKSVLLAIRNTSLFFHPQIRTKIMNEGWASYWHEALFLRDDRIKGHEIDFARVNAYVTSMPRVGLNPYALGLRLFQYLEETANKGRISLEFERLSDGRQRETYDTDTGSGREFIFNVRENFSDYLFIKRFLDQDFVNRHSLFVAGKRLSPSGLVWEYYVRSRRVEDYRQMILDSLYHPPQVEVDEDKSSNGELYMVHTFEGRPLVKDYIPNTMLGIEYLWGRPVHLETSEVVSVTNGGEMLYSPTRAAPTEPPVDEPEVKWQRVVYTMKDRKISKQTIH